MRTLDVGSVGLMERGERQLLLRRLIDWRPSGGVLSVYVGVDPGDRGQGWRIALRDRLRELIERTPPHDERRAFEAAARRVLDRFPESAPPPHGRGHAGFLEIADKPTEVWRSMQVAPRRLEVVRARRPYVRPLVEMFDDGPRVGVVLASAERARLLEWALGEMRELDSWEIVLWSRDWRERKAERALPGQHEGASASGRDQFGQRLEANRRRFLREVGETVDAESARREWRHLIAFGSEEYTRDLASGLGSSGRRLHTATQDLISARGREIAARVEAAVRELNRARELELVQEVEEAIGSSTGAALGPQEVLEALAQGRVRHLIFDADRDYSGRPLDARIADARDGSDSETPVAERMIALAVATGADITPVEDDPASQLAPHDGVAALLRY
jgi:Bacterial archaeo-eukaryotic release factor family 5